MIMPDFSEQVQPPESTKTSMENLESQFAEPLTNPISFSPSPDQSTQRAGVSKKFKQTTSDKDAETFSMQGSDEHVQHGADHNLDKDDDDDDDRHKKSKQKLDVRQIQSTAEQMMKTAQQSELLKTQSKSSSSNFIDRIQELEHGTGQPKPQPNLVQTGQDLAEASSSSNQPQVNQQDQSKSTPSQAMNHRGEQDQIK